MFRAEPTELVAVAEEPTELAVVDDVADVPAVIFSPTSAGDDAATADGGERR